VTHRLLHLLALKVTSFRFGLQTSRQDYNHLVEAYEKPRKPLFY